MNLNRTARIYVTAVGLAGAAAAAHLLSRARPETWDLRAIFLFGGMAVLASGVSVTYQRYLPSRIVYQISSSFAYALFFLVDPAAVCLVLLISAAADWGLNRRHPVTAIFNMAQFAFALWVATQVRGALEPGFTVLDPLSRRSLLSALASVLAFSLINQMLTLIVMQLASKRRLREVGTPNATGLLNEALCIVSGLGMAVLWWVRPELSLLGIAPIWILVVLLVSLSRREQELEQRETELRSLQALGLEVGSVLETPRLYEAVVRIAQDAVHGAGAMLAVADGGKQSLDILATRGLAGDPPATIPLSRLKDGFFEVGEPRVLEPLGAEQEHYPEFRFLKAEGVLCAPLRIGERQAGLLAVWRDERRRPFSPEDRERMATLLRFVDVALTNARMFQELREIQSQLVHTEKMSALGMLVAGVAHELNNPLTSVVGYTQLLLSSEHDPRKRRMLEKIFGEAERAGKIVRNLLTFSRKHRPEKKIVNVNRVLEQVLELREYDFRVRSLELVRRLDPTLPPVEVDAHQFQQVFLNLLSNAQQAIEETGRPGRILVETRAREGKVQVIIEDNGSGIRREDLGKIFLPFYTTRDVGRGTGLGLSICHGIVEEHGGTIRVESHPGAGARFMVEIPEAPGEARESAEVRQAEKARPATGGRVLVVDDEDAVAELVAEALSPRGFHVDRARSGREALERLQKPEDYDVLLVDLRMPGMDGREFFEALSRARPELARRIVFSTGDRTHFDSDAFLRCSPNPVLDKPYDLDSLFRILDQVMEEGGQVH